MTAAGEGRRADGPAEREVRTGGVAYRALEAWRGAGGHVLCYFLALEDGAPAGDDRRDRRAALEPGERLTELPEGEARARAEGARPLTDTERRFHDAVGTTWLAQNVGPVWAESGAAEGATGILFTSLGGPWRRAEAAGPHLGSVEEDDLRERLRAGLAAGEGGPAQGAGTEPGSVEDAADEGEG